MGQALPIHADPSGFDSELLTTAFACGPQGIALTENGRIVHANPAFAALYGYSNAEELEGRPWEDLRPQDSCCIQMSTAGSALNPGAPSSCEYLAHRKDGTSIRLESRCASVRSHERTFLMLSVGEASERERLHVVHENSSSHEESDPGVFFRKPFTGSALLGKVREILDTRDPKTVHKREKRKREKP